jgi:hypothetical protein
LVTKNHCDLCKKELERPIDIKEVRFFPGSEKEENFELCLDCLATKTIPVLMSGLLFSGDDPQKYNFSQFEGVWNNIMIDFGDAKSLLKKHYENFDDPFWGVSEEDKNRVQDALCKLE